MLLPHLLPLVVLAGSAAAKPVARASFHKRQFTNSSISGITKTETAPSPTKDTTPTCTATYTPNDDEDCGDIAKTYQIHLHQYEASYPSMSKNCEDLLRGYGICYNRSPKNETTNERTSDLTTGTRPNATGSLPGPTSSAGGTITNGTISNTNITSNSSDPIVAQVAGFRDRVVTRLETTTLSYTLGTADTTSLRTVVVTRTISEVIAFTTALTINPASSDSTSSTTTFATGRVLVTSPNPGATCSGVSPPPSAVTEAVVAGCSRWYTAVLGDFCNNIALDFGIPVPVFLSWNPTIDALTCSNLQAGSAYCVATCEDSDSDSAILETPSLTPSVSRVSSPTLLDAPSTTLSSISSHTPPAGVTSLPASLTLPAGVTSLTSSPTLPSATTSLLSSSLALNITVPSSSTSSQPAPSASSGTDVYMSYLGDGSVAASWPSEDQWVAFDYMFEQNRPNMKASCAQWGVPNSTDQEISDMKSAILAVSSSSRVDARFILAIIMQESTGCVRVITTEYSHANPGLMQSHNGTGTCNTNQAPLGIPGVPGDGIVQTPCPTAEIKQMVADGTEGTVWGDGLVQLLQQQRESGAQGYYRAARMYNGGSVDPSGMLERGCCTASYASDVANRLTGWVNAPRTFSG